MDCIIENRITWVIVVFDKYSLEAICSEYGTSFFNDHFDNDFNDLSQSVQDEILAYARLLMTFGPDLGRPHADTLEGSAYPNMKELRFKAGGGVWRVAFAFDPSRQAILLVAADKSGVAQKRFYKVFIAKADRRYRAHLERLDHSKKRK